MGECLINGTFSLAKKGATCGKDSERGKGTKIMAITDTGGAVLSVSIGSAAPHEVTLVETSLEERFIEQLPERLIGDRAYDSDALDEQLAEKGIKMIAPHRANHKKKKTQDTRKLSRYNRRWKVERFFAGLFNYRRCIVRYEYKEQNFKAIVLSACIIILLKSFFYL